VSYIETQPWLTAKDVFPQAGPTQYVMRLPYWFFVPDEDYFTTGRNYSFTIKNHRGSRIGYYSDFLESRELRKKQLDKYGPEGMRKILAKYESRSKWWFANHREFATRNNQDISRDDCKRMMEYNKIAWVLWFGTRLERVFGPMKWKIWRPPEPPNKEGPWFNPIDGRLSANS